MATAVPLIRSSLLAEFPALVVELGGNLEEILEEARVMLGKLSGRVHEVFGALSILTVQAGSVGHALQMFGRYLHYSVQAVRLEIREQGGLVFFVVDSPFVIAAGSDQFWDHAVALQCTVIRMVCGDSWAPRSTFLRRAEPRDRPRPG